MCPVDTDVPVWKTLTQIANAWNTLKLKMLIQS